MKVRTLDESLRGWMRTKGYREIGAHRAECDAFRAGFSEGIEAVIAGIDVQMANWRKRGGNSVEIVSAGIAAAIALKLIGPHARIVVVGLDEV